MGADVMTSDMDQQEPESVTITVTSKTASTRIVHTRQRVGPGNVHEPMCVVLKRATIDARTWLRRNA